MLLIIYDGECPFCNDYIARLRLQARCGPVMLVNARESSPTVSAYWQAGFDLDQGMVAVLDGNPFYGAEAVALLAELVHPDDLFNRLNRWLLSQPSVSKALYPLFKRARRIALAIKGTGPLRP
jgi:predicted DCC family thiol-disulfide oxidoreductase YuxK